MGQDEGGSTEIDFALFAFNLDHTFQTKIIKIFIRHDCFLVGEAGKVASDNCVGVMWRKPPKIWEIAQNRQRTTIIKNE